MCTTSLSKINGLQSDSLFLPILEVTIPFFFFFLQMTNVFVLFPFPQPSDTNGCWKRSKMKNLSWTQTALARLGCLSLIWETEKIQFGVCVCSVCVCVLNLHHITVALCKLGGRTRCSVALFEETFVFLSEVQAYLEGMRLIVAANKHWTNRWISSTPRPRPSRHQEPNKAASLPLSLRCQLGDYWVDLIPLIRISSDTTRRMATFKSDI